MKLVITFCACLFPLLLASCRTTTETTERRTSAFERNEARYIVDTLVVNRWHTETKNDTILLTTHDSVVVWRTKTETRTDTVWIRDTMETTEEDCTPAAPERKADEKCEFWQWATAILAAGLMLFFIVKK